MTFTNLRHLSSKQLNQPLSHTIKLSNFLNIRRFFLCLPAICATLSGTAVLAQAPGGPLLAQATPTLPNAPILDAPRVQPSGTTILPTDVLPLPTIQNRMSFGENLQLRILQKLPARFYMSGSVESSFRYETNIFQFPKKRTLMRQQLRGTPLSRFSAQDQLALSRIFSLASREDTIFRVLPNINAGFAITPRTRIFTNYFMIRDSLMKNTQLNTTIQSIAGGVQHDFQLGAKANLQTEFQFRELFQPHQQPVFDFLPGMTLSYVVTPRTVAFVNALLQLRGKKYFQAPTKEIDPFYTWGFLHQRGGWNFSASTTLVQNFREPFRGNASIPINNYAFICDFEVSRRLFRQLPGLQAFIRAEPIFNFASNETPGLAGTDFRLFWGLRMAASKPALTTALDSLRRQLEEQEVAPPQPTPSQPKPSAYLQPEQVIAATPQPIHGFMSDEGTTYRTGSTNDSLLSMHNVLPEANEAVASTPALLPARASIAQQISDSETGTGIATAETTYTEL